MHHPELSKREISPVAASRVFRFLEGSLIVLFLIQGLRAAFAILLTSVDRVIPTGQVDPLLAAAHLVLIGMLVLPWLTPRTRTLLPRFLLLSALAASVSRLVLAVPLQIVQLFAALLTIGAAGVYLATLLRANRKTWVTVIIVGLALEQLLRALNSYDITMQSATNLPIGDQRLQMPVIAIQLVISLVAIIFSIAARRTARFEPYQPGFLTTLGGAAFGGFLALELLLLNLPNVAARWSEVPYESMVPLLLLATSLPLMPGVREFARQALGIFEDRLQGWVWFFLLLLMLIVGNRLIGIGAAAALLLGQFIAITLLWWIPSVPERDVVEQVGPSLSFAMMVMTGIIYAYHFSLNSELLPEVVAGQSFLAILIAAGLLGIPRLFWREIDPWIERIEIPRSLPAAFVAPIVLTGLMLGGSGTEEIPPSLGDVRVATYQINSGYDEQGVFRLESTARSIEASVADIVLLQGVGTGEPTAYGIDEAVYLGKRLGMYQAYIPLKESANGIAVLSRWPLTDIHKVALAESIGMGALRVRITDPATERVLDVMTAELEPVTDEQIRLQQLAYLFSLVDPNVPVVFGVDLGATPVDIGYQQLTAVSFVDPDGVLGIERGFTFPASAPVERHDYVLIRGLIPVESRHVESTASSHRLVVVALKWP